MTETIRNSINRLIAFFFLIFLSPLLLILYVLVKLTSSGPFVFKQKRMGKDKKIFTIYKIRTMVDNAEKLKKRYRSLNEAEEPAFKIYNDPRYTKIGRFLSHTGLDEMLQLINIIKGEMTFVGPRPLPVEEAVRVPKKYWARFSVLPGLTSTWIVKGSHKLSFHDWMELDLAYIRRRGIFTDAKILLLTVLLIVSWIGLKAKSFLERKEYWLAGLLTGTGFIIRLNSALTKALWADEVFYFNLARNRSVNDLLLVRYWATDNPPLFLLLMKVWIIFGKGTLWLRLPGLIVFFASSYLFYKLLRKFLGSWSSLLILSYLIFSPFFTELNYWVSPYNFVLFLILFQLNLIYFFLFEDNRSKKQSKFIIIFSLTNFLLFNIHYSSVYLFISYPFILIYIFLKKKHLLKPFVIACLLSLSLVIPNLFLLMIIKKSQFLIIDGRIRGLCRQFAFSNPYLHLLDGSILKFNNIAFTRNLFYFLCSAAIFALVFFCQKKNVFLIIIFSSLFFISGLCIAIFSPKYPFLFIERTFSTFHLGFYFLLTYLLYSFKNSRLLQALLFILFLLILIEVITKGNYYKNLPYLQNFICGDVIAEKILKKSDYDKFIGKFLSLINNEGKTIVIVFWFG